MSVSSSPVSLKRSHALKTSSTLAACVAAILASAAADAACVVQVGSGTLSALNANDQVVCLAPVAANPAVQAQGTATGVSVDIGGGSVLTGGQVSLAGANSIVNLFAGTVVNGTNISVGGANSGIAVADSITINNAALTASGAGSIFNISSPTITNSIVTISGVGSTLTIDDANILDSNVRTLSGSTLNLQTGASLASSIDHTISMAGSSTVLIAGGAQVTNTHAGSYAIRGDAGSQHVTLAGTVTASGNAQAIDLGDGDDILTLNAGAVLNGNVFDSGGANDRVELNGTGALTATISGYDSLDMNGTRWTVASNLGMAAINVNSGDLVLQPATSSVVSSAITIASGARLVADGTGTAIALGNITGAGGVQVAGTGSLALNGNNTYTGGTQVDAGVLIVNSSTALGTGGVVLNDATLRLGTVTVANDISGIGAVEKTSSGVGVLTGNNTYSGGTNIVAGSLQVASDAQLGSGLVTVASGARLIVNNAATETFSLGITGAGGLIKAGAGDLVLSSTNTFSGGSTISSGVLVLNSGTALGAGAVVDNATLRIGDVSFANNVSGSGAIEKTSNGNGALTGNNTHSGGVNVLGGTLSASTNSLGSGTVTIGTGANLSFNNTTQQTVANTMAGAGTLIKANTGELILSGVGTRTGATQITGGTLTVNNGAALGTGNVSVASGSLLSVGATTIANAISGQGSLQKNSLGASVLTGTNTYSGGTNIQAGTLQVAGSAQLGTGAVTVGSGAGLIVNNSAQEAFGAAISGAGSLTKSGAGDLVLSQANAYTGGTTIQAGVLVLNNGGALGSGAVVDNATLRIGGIAFNNNVSGGGLIEKTSSGTADLTGINTHTGGVSVLGGTLNASIASLGTGTLTLAAGTTINLNAAGNAAFVGALAGNATSVFNKIGTGRLTLTGNGTLGVMNLNAGTTEINGNLIATGTSGVTVGTGATLSGSGTITGNVNNNGTLQIGPTTQQSVSFAPNHKQGLGFASLDIGSTPFNIVGNYVHGANATMEVEMNQSSIDVLNVSGTATINGGTLRLVSLDGADGSGRTFLHADGGVTGAFTTVEAVGGGAALVVYNPNDVKAGSFAVTVRPSTVNSQAALASQSHTAFFSNLSSEIDEGGRERSVWVRGIHRADRRDTTDGALAFDTDTNGVMAGMRLPFGNQWSANVAAGGSSGSADLANDAGSTDVSGQLLSAYAQWHGAHAYAVAGVDLGWQDFDTERQVVFNSIESTLTADASASSLGLFAGVGGNLHAGKWLLLPSLFARYQQSTVDQYQEVGQANLIMDVQEFDADSLQVLAKLRVQRAFHTQSGVSITPYGSVGVLHDSAVDDRTVDATLIGSATSLTLQGDDADRTMAHMALGLVIAPTERVAITADVQREQSSDDANTQASLGLRVSF